jgi:ubiquinone/menaquinone biosynthesis C-methylase UbiE
MAIETGHPMMAQMNHDEAARDGFVLGLKHHLSSVVGPGNRPLYENRVRSKMRRSLGREPRDRHEVRGFMEREPYHQAWGSLMRTAQEMMWNSVGASVDRQIGGLIVKSKARRSRLGSLRLDRDFRAPRYLTAIDHHGMPGSYLTDRTEDDVWAGAVYDRGAYIYQLGRAGGALMDGRGQALVSYLYERRPDLAPRRILDMGCTIGNSTLAFVDEYHEAEVFGVEPGAPILRYAHARAEHLGKRVHFSQQNAERTDFSDASFDLVISLVMLHETSAKALPNIFRECHRLLRPGGVMAHLEVPVRYKDMDYCDQVMRDWQTYYNDEPFWGQVCSTDLASLAKSSGFGDIEEGYQPTPATRGLREAGFTTTPHQSGGWWYVMSAVR